MKLTKLLPIATIASVTAVVTPLVTSCSKSEWNEFKIPDKLDGYKFVDRKQGELKVSESTKTYLTDVKENNKILADDWIQYYFDVPEDPEIPGDKWIGISSVDVENERISIRARYKNDKGSSYENWKNLKWKMTWGFTTRLSNWVFKPAYSGVEDLKKDTTWELVVNTKGQGSISREHVVPDGKYNSKCTDEQLESVWNYIYYYLGEGIPSRYLEEVQVKR